MTRQPRRGPGGEGRASRRDGTTREETSAGGVVFRRDGDSTLFLVIRDSYRNWGFPKGHIEEGEGPDRAALREVAEETGLRALEMRSAIETIEWHFRFRGRQVHKVCHFFLMESFEASTEPQRAEGITACRWATFDEASRLLSYENARTVLQRGHAILEAGEGAPSPAQEAG